MADEADYSSLSLNERLDHKVWKVRLEAYEELSKSFEGSRNGNDSCFSDYNARPDMIKRHITDSNVVAQEAALNAFMKYLEFGGTASSVNKIKASGTITTLCEKTLSSSRKNTKDFAKESLLLLIEITGDGNSVVEDIVPLFKHRLPKLVAGCVSALSDIVENYGCSVLSPKLIIDQLGFLFSHADRNVRAETTKLTVELYKWMKNALVEVLFPALKPVQQKDLKAAFDSIGDAPIEVKRMTRAQKEEAARKEQQESNPENDDIEMKDTEKAAPVEFDPYELLEPVEVLSQFPSDFETRVNSSKWKDRKEVLEEVHAVLEKSQKLASDDYSHLMRILAKCMKDANLQVVQLAANCIEFLVKGLRKEANKYLPLVLPAIIERTKEKKASTSTALSDALDALFHVSSLSEILDATLEGMKHKTVQVKISSSNFLQRCLAATTVPPKSNEVDAIVELGVKLLSFPQESVREAATEVIGTLMKITGQRELNTFLEKVDDNRRTKVVEMSKNVTVNSSFAPGTNQSSQPSQPSQPKVAAPKQIKKPATISRPKPPPSTSIPAKRGATSPAKRDEGPKVSSFGRSLTARSLASPATSLPPPRNEETSKLNEEIVKLRKEKETWLSQKQKDSQTQSQIADEKANINHELTSLKAEMERVSKDHNNAILMVKQKETQIIRLNSDLENAKLKIRDLEQTVEMMKLQQNQQSQTSFSNIPRPSIYSPAKALSPPQDSRMNSRELNSRVRGLSIDGESKENEVLKKSSPQKEPREMNFDTNDASWRKAAEVTSQLKARIEKMKARSRTGINLN